LLCLTAHSKAGRQDSDFALRTGGFLISTLDRDVLWL
jgi:hypothetical protein